MQDSTAGWTAALVAGECSSNQFEKWSEVLAPLHYSYARNAAHLDLSPRATVSMGAAPDPSAFVGMLEADVRWLFELLRHCRRARVLLATSLGKFR
jgi:hypothetical protein